MAATPDGIVALTVDTGPTVTNEETGDRWWAPVGPLRSWTSSDGTTWTAHPGPETADVRQAALTAHDLGWLQASTAPLFVIAAGKRPITGSIDGVAWKDLATSGLSSTFPAWGIKAVGSGFLAVRDDAIASSPDGRTWTKHTLPAPCSANGGMVFARDGLISTGTTEGNGRGVFPWVWCSSRDGQTWRQLKKLQPLGFMNEPGAQECLDACPDGALRGDGLRMIAYRGWGDDQAGWTSFDGRTWQPIAFEGRPERSSGWLDDNCTQSLVLLPMGLWCTATSGAVWFGDPAS
jgi:hypothetical protein